MHLAGDEVEAVVDTGAGGSVVGKHLARKLGMWKGARKVRVRQGDGNHFGGNFVANATFQVMDSYSVLGEFAMDTEGLDIGNRDVILRFFWLTENGFSVDIQNRYVRNVNSGQVIPCSVRCIPEVLIMEEEAVVDGEILLIINTSEQYACYTLYFSAKQAARLPEHKF